MTISKVSPIAEIEMDELQIFITIRWLVLIKSGIFTFRYRAVRDRIHSHSDSKVI